MFGVISGHRQPRRSGGFGDVGGGKLIHCGLGLRDVHVRSVSRPDTADQCGQCGDRRDPGDDMVGKMVVAS